MCFDLPHLTPAHLFSQRQMLQFIASLERMAAQSHWTGNNRFGSFAPIRLNVSAQWLVDGVSRVTMRHDPEPDPVTHLERLYVECQPSSDARKGAHIYPRLVALPWSVGR